MTYMLVVLLKRSFEPQEIAKEEDLTDHNHDDFVFAFGHLPAPIDTFSI